MAEKTVPFKFEAAQQVHLWKISDAHSTMHLQLDPWGAAGESGQVVYTNENRSMARADV